MRLALSAAVLVAHALVLPAQAERLRPPSTDQVPWTEPAPGLRHRAYTLDGPLAVNVLAVDLTSGLTIHPVPGHDNLTDREQPSSVMARYRAKGYEVLAATNGDFGGRKGTVVRNTPQSMVVQDGRMWVSASRRSSLSVNEAGEPEIARFRQTMTLHPRDGQGEPVIIENYNRWPDYSEAVLFSEAFGITERQEEPVFEVFFPAPEGGLTPEGTWLLPTVRLVQGHGGTPVPEGELALQMALDHRFVGRFPLGREWTLNIATEPRVEGWRSVTSGIPRIVTEGEKDVTWEIEGTSESFSTTLHPRTAAGFTEDRETLFLVVVDGRQPDLSVGVSLDQLAEIMIGEGAWEALNLDGGGSSCMIIGDEILNSPSDPDGERAVTSTILIVREAE